MLSSIHRPTLVGVFALALLACSDASTPSLCLSNAECERGELCSDGACVSDETPTSRGGGRGTADSGPIDDRFADTGSGPDDTSGESDVSGDVGLGPDSPGGEDALSDAGPDDAGPGDASGADTPVGDVGESLPPCSAPLTECALESGIRDDGSFWCLGSPDGGVCLAKCGFFGQTEVCGDQEICWAVSNGGDPVDACLPSQCRSRLDPGGDCGGDTCMMVREDIGLCFPAGELREGAPCTSGGAARCERGSFCAQASGASTGVCRQTCESWAPTNDCPGGQVCAPWFAEQGVCQIAVGGDPLTECTTPDTWCADRSECVTVNTGPTTEANLCINYCRRDVPADCSSIAPEGQELVCNWYAILVPRDMGACLSPCDPIAGCSDPAFTCGADRVCVRTCSTDAQCAAAGTPTTPWGCMDGVCLPR